MVSSVRGMDEKDKVKTMRDRARYDIAYSKDSAVSRLRPDTFKTRPAKGGNIKATNFSGANVKTGGDERDIVKNAIERSKRIKAHSVFMNTPSIVDTKIIKTSVGGPF